MAVWGAFAFGVVLGWFTYFTNRYRKGEVQFSDLATLIGVIGGGAVTALFGDAKTTLFGAYGIGLAVGFFAYFLVLLVLVRKSNGVFTLAWFLDGRRRKLEDDEEIPGDARGSGVAMAPRPFGSPRPASQPLASRPQLAAVIEQRDRAIAALAVALRELARRTGEEADASRRRRLQETHALVIERLEELVALRPKDLPDSEHVHLAIARLEPLTRDIAAAARELESSDDPGAPAAVLTDRATQATGFLAALFA